MLGICSTTELDSQFDFFSFNERTLKISPRVCHVPPFAVLPSMGVSCTHTTTLHGPRSVWSEVLHQAPDLVVDVL